MRAIGKENTSIAFGCVHGVGNYWFKTSRKKFYFHFWNFCFFDFYTTFFFPFFTLTWYSSRWNSIDYTCVRVVLPNVVVFRRFRVNACWTKVRTGQLTRLKRLRVETPKIDSHSQTSRSEVLRVHCIFRDTIHKSIPSVTRRDYRASRERENRFRLNDPRRLALVYPRRRTYTAVAVDGRLNGDNARVGRWNERTCTLRIGSHCRRRFSASGSDDRHGDTNGNERRQTFIAIILQ